MKTNTGFKITWKDVLEFRKTQETTYASDKYRKLTCGLNGAYNVYEKEVGKTWELVMHTYEVGTAVKTFNDLYKP